MRRTAAKSHSEPRDSEHRQRATSVEDGSGPPTPRVPALLSDRFGQDAYRSQLQRDLSDFAHPDFANEITPVVDVRDLFNGDEEFSAVFPRGWGRAPIEELSEDGVSVDDALTALPRGSPGVPEVDLEVLLDAVNYKNLHFALFIGL